MSNNLSTPSLTNSPGTYWFRRLVTLLLLALSLLVVVLLGRDPSNSVPAAAPPAAPSPTVLSPTPTPTIATAPTLIPEPVATTPTTVVLLPPPPSPVAIELGDECQPGLGEAELAEEAAQLVDADFEELAYRVLSECPVDFPPSNDGSRPISNLEEYLDIVPNLSFSVLVADHLSAEWVPTPTPTPLVLADEPPGTPTPAPDLPSNTTSEPGANSVESPSADEDAPAIPDEDAMDGKNGNTTTSPNGES